MTSIKLLHLKTAKETAFENIVGHREHKPLVTSCFLPLPKFFFNRLME